SQGGQSLSQSLAFKTFTDQQKYDFYKTDESTAQALLKKTTDPAQIKQLTDRIYGDISSAFDLLSPDQQKQSLSDYQAEIAKVNQEAQNELTKAQVTLTTNATDVLTQVKGALDDAAATMKTAADAQQAAANLQLQA